MSHRFSNLSPDLPADYLYFFISLFPQGNSNHWCSDLLKASEEFLSSVTLKQDSIDEELLTRHLFTVGEVAQVCCTFIHYKCLRIVTPVVSFLLLPEGLDSPGKCVIFGRFWKSANSSENWHEKDVLKNKIYRSPEKVLEDCCFLHVKRVWTLCSTILWVTNCGNHIFVYTASKLQAWPELIRPKLILDYCMYTLREISVVGKELIWN